jgi:hypothetical protein
MVLPPEVVVGGVRHLGLSADRGRVAFRRCGRAPPPRCSVAGRRWWARAGLRRGRPPSTWRTASATGSRSGRRSHPLPSGPRPNWLDFCLPLGGLGKHDERVGGFPFGDDGGTASQRWREPLDAWLAQAAVMVFAATPYDYAPWWGSRCPAKTWRTVPGARSSRPLCPPASAALPTVPSPDGISGDRADFHAPVGHPALSWGHGCSCDGVAFPD